MCTKAITDYIYTSDVTKNSVVIKTKQFILKLK